MIQLRIRPQLQRRLRPDEIPDGMVQVDAGRPMWQVEGRYFQLGPDRRIWFCPLCTRMYAPHCHDMRESRKHLWSRPASTEGPLDIW